MGELVRRMDYERRAKDLIKENAKSRFLTKEYSRPVQSANDLAMRKRQKIFGDINEDIRTCGVKHAAEKINLEYFRRNLGVVSINFDERHFQPSKSRRAKSASVKNARDIVNGLPTDCALDYGPGNRLMVFTNKSKMIYQASGSNKTSRAAPATQVTTLNNKRPATCIPTKKSDDSPSFNKSLFYRNDNFMNHYKTSQSARAPTNEERGSKSAHFSPATARPSGGGVTRSFTTNQAWGSTDSDSDSDENETYNTNDDNVDENVSINGQEKTQRRKKGKIQTLKSFRSLKNEHTYMEGELPDARRDKLNMMKNAERRKFLDIQNRIKDFYVEMKKRNKENGDVEFFTIDTQ